MRRREFIALLGATAVAAPIKAVAHTPIWTVGYLNSGSSRRFAHLTGEFNTGLRAAGYVDGRNVRIKRLYANGDHSQLAAKAGQLIQMGANVIATSGGNVALNAAMSVTSSVPIVYLAGRPPFFSSGNVTGVYTNTPNLLQQRIASLRAMPEVAGKSFALLVNGASPLRQQEEANLWFQGVAVWPIGSIADVQSYFSNAAANNYALMVSADPWFTEFRGAIIACQKQYNVFTQYSYSEFTDEGGTVCHGPHLRACYRMLGQKVGAVLANNGAVGSISTDACDQSQIRINRAAVRRFRNRAR